VIIHDCVQGTSKWRQLRIGMPTASEFGRIVTPGGKKNEPKPSDSQEPYMRELLAELIMGRPLEGTSMPWMERGHLLEEQAADFYGFIKDVEPEVVGFVTNDEQTIGASPDRFIGKDGMLEIKCPKPEVHVSYFLFSDIELKYKPQLQGQLYVTGRQWVDICSFHPEMPPAIVRVTRDEDFIKLLDVELQKFVARLAEKRAELDARGLLAKPEVERDHSGDFLSDADAEMIVADRFPVSA